MSVHLYYQCGIMGLGILCGYPTGEHLLQVLHMSIALRSLNSELIIEIWQKLFALAHSGLTAPYAAFSIAPGLTVLGR